MTVTYDRAIEIVAERIGRRGYVNHTDIRAQHDVHLVARLFETTPELVAMAVADRLFARPETREGTP